MAKGNVSRLLNISDNFEVLWEKHAKSNNPNTQFKTNSSSTTFKFLFVKKFISKLIENNVKTLNVVELNNEYIKKQGKENTNSTAHLNDIINQLINYGLLINLSEDRNIKKEYSVDDIKNIKKNIFSIVYKEKNGKLYKRNIDDNINSNIIKLIINYIENSESNDFNIKDIINYSNKKNEYKSNDISYLYNSLKKNLDVLSKYKIINDITPKRQRYTKVINDKRIKYSFDLSKEAKEELEKKYLENINKLEKNNPLASFLITNDILISKLLSNYINLKKIKSKLSYDEKTETYSLSKKYENELFKQYPDEYLIITTKNKYSDEYSNTDIRETKKPNEKNLKIELNNVIKEYEENDKILSEFLNSFLEKINKFNDEGKILILKTLKNLTKNNSLIYSLSKILNIKLSDKEEEKDKRLITYKSFKLNKPYKDIFKYVEDLKYKYQSENEALSAKICADFIEYIKQIEKQNFNSIYRDYFIINYFIKSFSTKMYYSKSAIEKLKTLSYDEIYDRWIRKFFDILKQNNIISDSSTTNTQINKDKASTPPTINNDEYLLTKVGESITKFYKNHLNDENEINSLINDIYEEYKVKLDKYDFKVLSLIQNKELKQKQLESGAIGEILLKLIKNNFVEKNEKKIENDKEDDQYQKNLNEAFVYYKLLQYLNAKTH